MKLDLPELLEFKPGDTKSANVPPHCGKCGRFIKPATVRTHRHWEYMYEVDYTGQCSVCGPTDVVWERT